MIAVITTAFKSNEITKITDDFYDVKQPIAYHVPDKTETINDLNKKLNEIDFSIKTSNSFIDFKESLAYRESGNNYKAVNTFGYLGKYQFGKATLKFLGLNDHKDFLNNPELQEKAFIAYLKKNKWILKRDIKRYAGKTIGGVKITESGILAAAHLGGVGSVQDFLRSNGSIEFTDGYGTNIKSYLKEFANYNLKEIKGEKSPIIN